MTSFARIRQFLSRLRGLKRLLLCIFVVLFVVLFVLLLPHSLLRIGLMPWKHVYRYMHGDDAFVIYVIGGSTAVGEPFSPKMSYPRLVSYMYGDRVKGRQVEIVNLARSGRDVEYGYWQLLNTLASRPQRGVLLLYSGINDLVTKDEDDSFYRWRLLQGFVIPSRLQYVFEDHRTSPFVKELLGVSHNSLGKYEYRLTKVVELAQQYDLKVVISTLVGNTREFGPCDISDRLDEVPEPLRKPLSRAIALENAGRYGEALAAWQAFDEHCPGAVLGRVYYHLAKCLEKVGRPEEAREYYWRAADSQPLMIPNRWKNQVIRDVAARTGSVLVDTVKAFEAVSPGGVTGYNLIIDAHHPNLEGYLLLSEGFAQGMGRAIGERPTRERVSVEEVERRFSFNSDDWAQVYFTRAAWILNYLAFHGDFQGEKSARVREYLAKAESFKSAAIDENELAFMRFAVAALGRNSTAASYWMTRWDARRNGLRPYQGNWLAKQRHLIELLPAERRSRLTQEMEEFTRPR